MRKPLKFSTPKGDCSYRSRYDSSFFTDLYSNDLWVQRPIFHVGGPQSFGCIRVLISHIHSPGRLLRPQPLGTPRCSKKWTLSPSLLPNLELVTKRDKNVVAKIWHHAGAYDIRYTQVESSKKCRVVCKSEHLASPSFRMEVAGWNHNLQLAVCHRVYAQEGQKRCNRKSTYPEASLGTRWLWWHLATKPHTTLPSYSPLD